MKKHLIAALLAMVMCLAALSGCTLVKGFEKDVQVVLNVNGEYQGCYTVNIFNNAIVPVPEAPKGLKFYGWTAEENWEEVGADNVPVTANKGLVRYDDVKDWVKGDELSVTLYPVFGEIIRHDIAIAWYDKDKTSGLNASVMSGFETKLNAFLKENGYNTEDMDIVIRAYAGNVGPTCDAIRSDGDIDIMVGWSDYANLSGTGGMMPDEVLENHGNILINPDFKARYAAKLYESETVDAVYGWILDTYAGEGGATLDYKYEGNDPEPEPEPEPEPDDRSGIKYTIGAEDVISLKIGCYGLFETSGFSNEIKANFEDGLKAALKVCGASDEQLAGVEVKFYCLKETGGSDSETDVTALDKAIEADGGVNILLGGRALAKNKAPYLNPLIKESSGDMSIGTSNNRKVIRFTNDGLALAVYNWILSAEGLALLAAPATV